MMTMALQRFRTNPPVYGPIVAGCLLVAGCQSAGPARPESRVITLGEFSATPNQPSMAGDVPPTPDREPLVLGAGGSESIGPEQLRAETPPAAAAAAPADDFVVESLVGQVNGRPIYADEFFEPIEDELIAIARRETPRRFELAAQQLVEFHLRNVVQNELFLAEAEAELSDRERIGLLAFMKDLQEQTISDRGGVESVTRSRLLSEEGITLDQYLEFEKDKTLIRKLVADRIAPRVIISWRDMQREYERRYDEFNPPARVTLWRIMLSTERDAELIDQVTTRLATGESFRKVAESLGGRQGGEFGQFDVPAEGLAGIDVAEPLRVQLDGLQEGETAGPFEVGSRTWWLHVAEFSQPEQRSIYDPVVQRMLAESLFAQRFEEEQRRFMDSLLEDGIYDELTAMRNRLLAIAIERYGP